MSVQKKPSELMAVLDYVLNRCTLREIDALEAAVKRRRQDLTAQTGIISLDPEYAAHSMSVTVQDSINSSMNSIRGTFRDFATNMLLKEAPELTREQMEEMVDQWIPEHMAVDSTGKVSSSTDVTGQGGHDRYVGLSKKGLINGIPIDAMYNMICQFVEYSTGRMTLSDESLLREEIGDWTNIYWKKFPAQIRSLIKLFLAGELDGARFDHELSLVLQ